MRYLILVLIMCLTACVGENVKKSNSVRERLNDRTNAALDTSKEVSDPIPLVSGIKGSNNYIPITITGDLPNKQTHSDTKKDLQSNSVFDMSVKSVYEKVSGWLYLLMVISAWGAWMLYNRIKNSTEGKALSRVAKTIYKAGKAITDEMIHHNKDSAEWNVLQKLHSGNQQELVEAQRNAPPRK